MEPVSSVIYRTLMRQAIANGRGGARDGRRMEKAGSSHEGASRQVRTDAPREEVARHRPLPRSVSPGKLDMTMRKWRTIRVRPLLMIIDGGMA